MVGCSRRMGGLLKFHGTVPCWWHHSWSAPCWTSSRLQSTVLDSSDLMSLTPAFTGYLLCASASWVLGTQQTIPPCLCQADLASLSNCNILQATNLLINFLVATLEKEKETNKMNPCILQHVINIKIINEVFYILFFLLRLQNRVCILHSQHISVQASTFQGPSSHTWLVAIIPNSPALIPPRHSLTHSAGPWGSLLGSAGHKGM